MKATQIKISIGIMLVFSFLGSRAQLTGNEYPTVGQPCPDFTLSNVENYSKNTLSLKDVKGKWLILDFWSQSCKVCIASFPKVNRLQQQFKDEVQFVLVGNSSKKYNAGIIDLYDRISVKQNLDLAISFDSLLFDRFGVSVTPYIIIIDPNGIVRALTYTDDINEKTIGALLAGDPVNFNHNPNPIEKAELNVQTAFPPQYYPPNDPGLVHYSFLSKWNDRTPVAIYTKIDRNINSGWFRGTAMSLNRLYLIAYLGTSGWSDKDSLYAKFWSKPILELADTSLFFEEFSTKKGLYTYCLAINKEKANQSSLQRAMQADLYKLLGYHVKIEDRKMPCWFLVRTSDKPPLTKGEAEKRFADAAGGRFSNIPIHRLLGSIWSFHQGQSIFIDHTEITGNVDINLEANMFDLEQINQSLQSQGLKLIKGVKKMKVLVIRD